MRSIRRGLRLYIAGLALIGVLGVTPAHAGPVSEGPALALANVHIDNFGQVDAHYFRGAQPKSQDFQALSALGVKMMIDLASEGDPAEEAHAREAGMRFVRIPMSTHEAPSAKVIAQFLSLVNDPANQPVYVHCIGGRHRTGVMTAIYRMTDFGWNWTQAFGEMKKYKYGAEFLHPEFKAFLETYVPTVAAAPSAVSAPK
jgi:protein tyrosine/serine phosphatase